MNLGTQRIGITIGLMISNMLGTALAEGDELPNGVGAYRIGRRQISPISESYDANGHRQGIGSTLDRSFSGPSILQVNDGSDLFQLAEELSRFQDPENGGTYADRLQLGQLRGDVRAKVDSQIFGLAFGLPDSSWVFFGVPYISAQVDARIAIEGPNNARTIRDELGGLAFEDLRVGLDKAAAFDVDDIHAAVADQGYQPIGGWSHRGVGDIRIGGGKNWQAQLASRGRLNQQWSVTAMVPTGYVERPDILMDTSFGQGHYELINAYDLEIDTRRGFKIGAGMAYGWTLNSQRQMRVPQGDEILISADRTTMVSHRPGDNLSASGRLSYGVDWWQLSSLTQWSKHYSDGYSGKLSGNYAKLALNSESERLEQRVSVSASSVQAYQRNAFLIPAIVEFSAAKLMSARNALPQDYYEISITSFFDTRSSVRQQRHQTSNGQKIAAN